MDKTLKILVVDDHPAFLKGLASSIGVLPIAGQVETCLNYQELKRKLRQFIPDVVFLDLNLPDNDGFTICRELIQKYPKLIVAIVTSYDVPHFAEKAKRYGASAYFLKNTDLDAYSEFLSSLETGRPSEYHVYIPTETGKRDFNWKDSFELKGILTKREREIMKMIVAGHNHHEIQEMLDIQYDTFRTHHNSILNKLGLKNDIELVRFADKTLAQGDY